MDALHGPGGDFLDPLQCLGIPACWPLTPTTHLSHVVHLSYSEVIVVPLQAAWHPQAPLRILNICLLPLRSYQGLAV